MQSPVQLFLVCSRSLGLLKPRSYFYVCNAQFLGPVVRSPGSFQLSTSRHDFSFNFCFILFCSFVPKPVVMRFFATRTWRGCFRGSTTPYRRLWKSSGSTRSSTTLGKRPCCCCLRISYLWLKSNLLQLYREAT